MVFDFIFYCVTMHTLYCFLNDFRYYVYYKSLFGTGRDGRDGTNGAKVCNVFLFYHSFQYQRHKICHKSQLRDASRFHGNCSSLPWLLSNFFSQGEKGDIGLRGLDGNAGVKVDTAVVVT